MSKGSVATQQRTDLAPAIDFAADAGRGQEGADRASYAIPFLVVLQANSPQLDAIKDAKAGMFLNSVTNELASEVTVIPCAFQRRYLEWAPRERGGGYRGEHAVVDVEGQDNKLGWRYDENGRMVRPDGNILRDTRNHFVLVVNSNGSTSTALLSLSSTQIKKSKRWMSRIQSVQMRDANGKLFNPASYSHMYKLTTVSEENDKGKWKGVQIDLIGPVQDPEIYAQAKHFYELVAGGKVEIATPPAEGDGGGESF